MLQCMPALVREGHFVTNTLSLNGKAQPQVIVSIKIDKHTGKYTETQIYTAEEFI